MIVDPPMHRDVRNLILIRHSPEAMLVLETWVLVGFEANELAVGFK
jgi:hypothetical protein